jgi:hypothetical protein
MKIRILEQAPVISTRDLIQPNYANISVAGAEFAMPTEDGARYLVPLSAVERYFRERGEWRQADDIAALQKLPHSGAPFPGFYTVPQDAVERLHS